MHFKIFHVSAANTETWKETRIQRKTQSICQLGKKTTSSVCEFSQNALSVPPTDLSPHFLLSFHLPRWLLPISPQGLSTWMLRWSRNMFRNVPMPHVSILEVKGFP